MSECIVTLLHPRLPAQATLFQSPFSGTSDSFRELTEIIAQAFRTDPDEAVALLAEMSPDLRGKTLRSLLERKPHVSFELPCLKAYFRGDLPFDSGGVDTCFGVAAAYSPYGLEVLLDQICGDEKQMEKLAALDLRLLVTKTQSFYVMKALLARDGPAQAALLEKYAGNCKGFLYMETGSALALIELARESPNPTARQLSETLGSKIAKRAPRTLMQIALEESDPILKQSYADSLFSSGDYEAASLVAAGTGQGKSITDFYLLMQSAFRSGSADERGAAITGAVAGLAGANPEETASHILMAGNTMEGDAIVTLSARYPEVVQAMVAQLAKYDVYAAADAVVRLPLPERTAAMIFAVADQIPRDFESQAQWLMSAPAGPERDGRLSAALKKLGKSAPQRAAALADEAGIPFPSGKP